MAVDRSLIEGCDACVDPLIIGILVGSINFYAHLSCAVATGRSVLDGIANSRNENGYQLRKK